MNQRVTIRLPQELADAIDLRARLVGQAQNSEYVRAIRAYLGDEGEVVTVDCPAAAVHGWVSRDDIVAALLSAPTASLCAAGWSASTGSGSSLTRPSRTRVLVSRPSARRSSPRARRGGDRRREGFQS